MWDLIISVPDHCLSFYFENDKKATLLYLSFCNTFDFILAKELFYNLNHKSFI